MSKRSEKWRVDDSDFRSGDDIQPATPAADPEAGRAREWLEERKAPAIKAYGRNVMFTRGEVEEMMDAYAASRLAEQRQALESWLVHRSSCEIRKLNFEGPWKWRDGDESTCTCGLAAALEKK